MDGDDDEENAHQDKVKDLILKINTGETSSVFLSVLGRRRICN